MGRCEETDRFEVCGGIVPEGSWYNPNLRLGWGGIRGIAVGESCLGACGRPRAQGCVAGGLALALPNRECRNRE